MQINGRMYDACGLEELILLSHPYYQKQATNLIYPYLHISGILLRYRKTNPKFLWHHRKPPGSQTNFEKE